MPGSEKLKKIKLIVFDVDGIFTDGLSWQDANGVRRRSFCIRDAMGIRALIKSGYHVCVVSASQAPEIIEHISSLGIKEALYGIEDKASVTEDLIAQKSLAFEECAIVSLRMQDLELMTSLGCGITVPAAPSALKNAAAIVTQKAGGDGAVLEICNRLLNFGAHADSFAISRSGRRVAF